MLLSAAMVPTPKGVQKKGENPRIGGPVTDSRRRMLGQHDRKASSEPQEDEDEDLDKDGLEDVVAKKHITSTTEALARCAQMQSQHLSANDPATYFLSIG